MPDRLIERTLRAFSDELSADTPVPGGGSAAAYAGAMGAALAAMVARIASKKEGSEPARAFAEEMDALRAQFLRFVDEDSASYAQVAAAMKLPRKTDEEKAARQERMQTALLVASHVPLEVARTARRLLDACERGVELASPMTASDVGVGALMAEAALRGAALNVMINLASVKDPAQVKALSEDLDHTLEGTDEQRRRITDFIESRIAR
ncbi:MAG TPA: cyclodeaminase/cyclohydrolase family protein [Candidatus Limnocylindria bacterium]|jgi:glutamate formiminotransferase/formiminotetrahydrofolate cyclodeaminase|nr:cyclodeaminase/cyclohydrolase family protein [Candidatus Limnocylindria bacterium]